MKYKKLYVAATNQHVGKTTSTLGLIHALKANNIDTGYCKPVGQEFVELEQEGFPRVDKDTMLFSKVMKFDIEPKIHSPIIIGKGATAKFLDYPENYDLESLVYNAANELERRHEMVVYEGTGHPGVGRVANLSNAQVAKMLGAGVIMIAKGGIGNTIDRLHLSMAVFREQQVPILGVIINKVRPDKIDKIRHYIGKHLDQIGIPLLGLVPYDRTLSNPLMVNVKDAVMGEVLMNKDFLDNKVEDIVAGSLVDKRELKRFNNLLLVVSITRLQEAVLKIKTIAEREGHHETPLSGIIVTNSGIIGSKARNYIEKHNIPLIKTHLDTYGSVLKISRIEVKINTRTPWKVQRANELIKENVDLSLIL
jgi:dethiobiotin synthetase